MKLYFIILNVFFLGLIACLGYFHFKHEPPKPDKILEETPKKANNHREKGVFEIKTPFKFKIPQKNSLFEKNLFDPRRGKKEVVVEKKEVQILSDAQKKKIELVGICRIGKFKAAIISDKSASSSRRKLKRPVKRTGGKTSKPTVDPLASKRAKDVFKPARRRYYREGEKLQNNSDYTVKKIHFDSVLLSAGKDEFVLHIERNDVASSTRAKSLPSRIKPSTTTPNSLKGTPSKNIPKTSLKTRSTQPVRPKVPSRFKRFGRKKKK